MNVLAVIPARAGSKGIPRKNVRLMAGKPLVSYAMVNAKKSKFITDVVVTSDDIEVMAIAKQQGIDIVNRPAELCEDHVTLDAVVYQATQEMIQRKGQYDIVITLQPTSPLLTADVLDDAIEMFMDSDSDTMISAVNEPHLSWGVRDNKFVPNYKERLNRQYLPADLKETGAFVITKEQFVKENGRFGQNISIYEMPENQAVDIDTARDWIVAESELSRKNILIRVDGYRQIGLGHIYRALLLAYHLTEHNVIFVLSKKSDIGIAKIKASFFKYFVIEEERELCNIIKQNQIDVVVNDILDTDASYMKMVKETGVRLVNFEDMGEGSKIADAVINALYEKQFEAPNYYWGKDYYCIRDEFLLYKKKEFSKDVKEVLVLFGGTDPCNLTHKLIEAINHVKTPDIHYTVVLGLGYQNEQEIRSMAQQSDNNIDVVCDVKNMAELMSQVDLAVSSQGRTMFELASIAVPTIILAQNEREQMHGFGELSNGFMNLGYGADVSAESVTSTIDFLIQNHQIRKNMYDRMASMDLLHGINRIKKIILGDDM